MNTTEKLHQLSKEVLKIIPFYESIILSDKIIFTTTGDYFTGTFIEVCLEKKKKFFPNNSGSVLSMDYKNNLQFTIFLI